MHRFSIVGQVEHRDVVGRAGEEVSHEGLLPVRRDGKEKSIQAVGMLGGSRVVYGAQSPAPHLVSPDVRSMRNDRDARPGVLHIVDGAAAARRTDGVAESGRSNRVVKEATDDGVAGGVDDADRRQLGVGGPKMVYDVHVKGCPDDDGGCLGAVAMVVLRNGSQDQVPPELKVYLRLKVE